MQTTIRLRPDRRDAHSRAQLIDRVRAEFIEMPCLRLTRAQAQRLFGLRADVCGRVLATLVVERTLFWDGERFGATPALRAACDRLAGFGISPS